MIAWGVYFEKTPTFSEASSVTAADTVSDSGSRNVVWDVIHAYSLTRRTANCKKCWVAPSWFELDDRPLVAIVSRKSDFV